MTGDAEPDAATWRRWLAGDHPDLAALRGELDAGHGPHVVHVGRGAVVAAQTRHRLSQAWTRHLPGRGPDALDAWARDHPQERLTTYFIAGSQVDGYVVADAVDAIVIAVIDVNRPMVPVID